ncbi:MAG: cytochrome c biogenesis protein CcsA [Phycisphaerae bacterium]|nr:cytochrome c biogenesis protein CcsA [Phycisphaerae bacterium]
MRIRPIDWMVVLGIGGLVGWSYIDRPAPRPEDRPSAFAQAVDLAPLYRAAVQADGRVRSFESHAKTYMGYVSGPREIHGQPDGYTYLDMLLRPERYDNTDTIYVKNKLVREQIANVLDEASRDEVAMGAEPVVSEDWVARFMKRGLISPALLQRPDVDGLLQHLGQDLIKTSKEVDAIHSALTVSDARFLADRLRLIPTPTGETDRPWIPITDVAGPAGAPRDATHMGMERSRPIEGLDPKVQESLAQSWDALVTAWRAEDAGAVNTQIAKLATVLPSISPHLYPSPGRLSMESWYFRNKSMTWVWLLYLASVVPLLMATIYQWDRARTVGMVLFVIAFAAHTASVIIRWYISGRWPNANMFEAVTTAAWFGGVGALIIEALVRRTPFRNLFALGSAVMSMAALMAAYFIPTGLDSTINNKMPALNDVWLYIHTNVIIWSYAIIGLACVPALLYLRNRWCSLWDQGLVPKGRLLLLPVAVAALHATGLPLLMNLLGAPSWEMKAQTAMFVGAGFWASLMFIVLELAGARGRRLAGTKVERSAVGGAAALILGTGERRSAFLHRERPSTGEVYDGATMVLVELSFVMLWAGLVMGAIWADHSWGRPWGWDPKEVFALNTFIIFLILIHVRLKVRDKGFWTAVLAILGFEVMMFNWIAVNFVITGLHSYA